QRYEESSHGEMLAWYPRPRPTTSPSQRDDSAMSGSRAVPESLDRLDLRRVLAEVGSQPTQVRIDVPRVALLDPPHGAQQLLAAKHATGFREQGCEEPQLEWPQRQQAVAAANFMGDRIDGQRAAADQAIRRCGPLAPRACVLAHAAGECPDAKHDFVDVE